MLSTNNWNILKENSRSVADAVNAITPGRFQVVILEARPDRPAGRH
ncbi:MAG: hypothetical protein ABI383_10310 [Acidobacteriaceae bacterium]